MSSEARRGAFYHPMLAFDTNGISLELLGSRVGLAMLSVMIVKRETKEATRKHLSNRRKLSMASGLEMAKSAAVQCSETTCVCMGDSESDIYELFVAHATCETSNLHLLIRGGQNRNTTENQDWADQSAKLLRSQRSRSTSAQEQQRLPKASLLVVVRVTHVQSSWRYVSNDWS